MKTTLTSRERMMAALSCQPVDHPPCSFMMYKALRDHSSDYLNYIQRQLDLGLDAYAELPPRPPTVVNDYYNLHGLAVNFDRRVQIKEWIEKPANETVPVMVKEYHTPAGVLRTEVRHTTDWRWGNHVPFLDDYIIPRARRFPVNERADLAPLRYLLAPPTSIEIDEFRSACVPAIAQARRLNLLSCGGWGVGADLIGWIYGLERMLFATYDQPEFVRDLLGIIAEWNRLRMTVYLGVGLDLFIKRGWYENCDFWTPASWKQLIQPILRSEVELSHSAGTKFGYIITSNCMPILDLIAETGVDVIIGVDPMRWNMTLAKEKLKGKVCLWGGVNGHMTIEKGTPGQVRVEVQRAFDILAPGGGFILSPVDNVRESTPTANQNAQALIAEWKRLAG